MSNIQLYHGDCLDVLKSMPDNSVDSIVTDPPYGLSFMGKKWDYDVPSEEIWRECLRVLKPGGHLLAFAGTRTQHRMAVRIEDAGFEIRDMIAWIYGSGFPKSLDVSKAIDGIIGKQSTGFNCVGGGGRTNGGDKFRSDHPEFVPYQPTTDDAKKWDGWGTALKPALEPITVARKPLSEKTVAANVLKWGTGAINIDGGRVGTEERTYKGSGAQKNKLNNHGKGDTGIGMMDGSGKDMEFSVTGRWPANVCHDGSDEVLELFPETKSGATKRNIDAYDGESNTGFLRGVSNPQNQHGDSGSAARFFYCAKASKRDRDEGCDGFDEKKSRDYRTGNVHNMHGGRVPDKICRNNHPTVKPTNLMRYLVRLVTPPGGVVLDPFMGSGSTGKAARLEGFDFIGIEREAEYVEIARARINHIDRTA